MKKGLLRFGVVVLIVLVSVAVVDVAVGKGWIGCCRRLATKGTRARRTIH